MKTPYSYTIDFSVQRELKAGFTVEAAYVGRLSIRLLATLNSDGRNRKSYASLTSGAKAAPRTPLQQ